jgi:hypothetical protein
MKARLSLGLRKPIHWVILMEQAEKPAALGAHLNPKEQV